MGPRVAVTVINGTNKDSSLISQVFTSSQSTEVEGGLVGSYLL